MLSHHPLLRHLRSVREIHGSEDRLTVHSNTIQCRIEFMRVERGDTVVPLFPDARDLPANACRYRQFARGLPRILGIVPLVKHRLPGHRKRRFTAARTITEHHGSQAVATGSGSETVLGREVARKCERPAIERLVVGVLHIAPVGAEFERVLALHPVEVGRQQIVIFRG